MSSTPEQQAVPDHVRVADAIATRIASGELRPGDRLAPIGELAGQYAAGRSAVSSALLLLSTRGLIDGPQDGRVFVSRDPAAPSGGEADRGGAAS